MRKLLLAFLGAAILGTAILGTVPALAADTCIRRNDIRDWFSPARRQLILENYARQKVMLTMTGSCLGFGPYDSFQITGPLESNVSCVESGDTVRTHWAGEPGRCTITSITPYAGELHPKGARHLVM